MADEPTTPEGRLILTAMQRRGWKAPRLATEAGFGVDWVRANVRGSRSIGKGSQKEVVPDAIVLARLAKALGNVSPDQLRAIERPDAADALLMLSGADVETELRAESTPLRRLIRIRDDIDTLIGELRGDG